MMVFFQVAYVATLLWYGSSGALSEQHWLSDELGEALKHLYVKGNPVCKTLGVAQPGCPQTLQRGQLTDKSKAMGLVKT